MKRQTLKAGRQGFTLVELVIVITIILVITTLVLLVLPSLSNYQKTSRGSGLLQEWLLTAKQRAMRDQVPRGLRLLMPDSANLVRSAQYIEQPDDLTGGKVGIHNAPSFNMTSGSADFSGGFAAPPSLSWPAQTNDFLLLQGQLYRITAVNSSSSLTVFPSASGDVPDTTNYSVIRTPRVLVGEAPMLLPQDVVVDLNLSVMPLDVGGFDILFSPSGAVLRNGTTTSKFFLWVRDGTLDPANPGEQVVIAVYSRTGLIASQPGILVSGAPDFSFAWDGKNSGL